jgi:hypothetical protein
MRQRMDGARRIASRKCGPEQGRGLKKDKKPSTVTLSLRAPLHDAARRERMTRTGAAFGDAR